MASFQASIKKTFDNPIESKRRDLKLYKERIKFNKEKESKNLIEIELKHEEAILGDRTCMYFVHIMFNSFQTSIPCVLCYKLIEKRF